MCLLISSKVVRDAHTRIRWDAHSGNIIENAGHFKPTKLKKNSAATCALQRPKLKRKLNRASIGSTGCITLVKAASAFTAFATCSWPASVVGGVVGSPSPAAGVICDT